MPTALHRTAPGPGGPPRPPGRLRRLALAVLMLLVPLAAADDGETSVTDAEFTAVLLSRIPQYIQFSDPDGPGSPPPIVIGLFGEDVFKGLLQKLVAPMRLGGRPVEVRVVPAAGPIGNCEILFVPAAQNERWQALANPSPPGLMTVGEHKDFIDGGGILRVLAGERRLEFGLRNARASGLNISSRLVKVSRVVR